MPVRAGQRKPGIGTDELPVGHALDGIARGKSIDAFAKSFDDADQVTLGTIHRKPVTLSVCCIVFSLFVAACRAC